MNLMIRKFSLFLAKLSLVLLFVTLGVFLALPSQARAETENSATLEFQAKDANGAKMTGINVHIYLQLTDINGQPVLGNRILDGYIGETGQTTIKFQNDNGKTLNLAFEYSKTWRDFEKFYIYDQKISGVETKNVTLLFSSARIVLKDKQNNLLKDQGFDIFSASLDDADHKVAFKQLYGGQTTGILGYKMYYLVPGEYIVRVLNKDYFFVVTKDKQTNVEIIVEKETPVVPVGDTYGYLTVVSKAANGEKVTNINFAVYEQKTDINGKPVFGDRLAEGYIGDIGSTIVKIRMNNATTKIVGIEYAREWRNDARYTLWNQTIKANEYKESVLTYSTVRIVLKDSSGQLLKDMPFDIYSTVNDANGKKVAKDNLYGWQKTGVTGEKVFVLIPNNYILRVKFPDINFTDEIDFGFTTYQNFQTELTYTLADIKVASKERNGNLRQNVDFKVYIKDWDSTVWSWKELGTYNTNNGVKKIYLPAGDYKIAFKDNQGQFNNETEFHLNSGQEKEFGQNTGLFYFKLMDMFEEPVKGQRISLYKFVNNQRTDRLFWGNTDNKGVVELPLDSGHYQIVIDGIYSGQNYTTSPFFVSEGLTTSIEYTLAHTHLHLQNKLYQDLRNQPFTLYNYATDVYNNLLGGAEIGVFSTGYNGYADLNLPGGSYILKTDGTNQSLVVNITDQKYNDIYLILNQLTASYSTPTTNTTTTTSTPTVNYSLTTSDSNNLYAKDSDSDGLADFEEYYIWKTNSYNNDSDSDGYSDKTEISNKYNPNGAGAFTWKNFAYGKPRTWSPSMEKDKAAYLKAELVARLGRSIGVAANNWSTLVNSYIYGGYTIDEIKDTLVYGPGKVHPTIPAVLWRKR